MYLDAKLGRRWRKARKRGVSPIIATILLVAITVVLAAVLYVLISNLTKGPGNTPLGGAFSYGSQTTLVGSSSTPGCASGHFCWSIPVGTASGGLTAGSLLFKVTNGVGTSQPANVSLISFTGTAVANWTYGSTTVSGASTAMSTTQTLVVDSGKATSSDPYTGFTLTALGQGSFAGQVTLTLS